MEVEDTKDRVFIHSLDDELAEIESDEEHPIFMGDIEKHLLNRIPRAVLVGDDDKKALESMQMVLYRVPDSLTLSPEEDSVRRAIEEARQRARDGQPFRIPANPKPATTPSTTSIRELQPAYVDDDSDAMDTS
jgi:hypothetical protein